MINECLILAGGFGKRLKDTISDLPKPMAPINGKPFLEYLLDYLNSQGMKKVVLSVGYMKEKITEYFGSSFKNMDIIYSIENEPPGTGGAIKQSESLISSEVFFAVNGDTLFMVDFSKLYEFFLEKRADMVIALKHFKDCSRYGSVKIEQKGHIEGFIEKQVLEDCIINGGVYFISKELFKNIDIQSPFAWEKDFLEKYYERFKFYGLVCEGYFIDIGTTEDYRRAQHELRNIFK